MAISLYRRDRDACALGKGIGQDDYNGNGLPRDRGMNLVASHLHLERRKWSGVSGPKYKAAHRAPSGWKARTVFLWAMKPRVALRRLALAMTSKELHLTPNEFERAAGR